MFDPKTASALGELQDRANCLKDVPAALAGMTIITLSDELILRRRSASFLHFQDIWPTLLLVGNGVGNGDGNGVGSGVDGDGVGGGEIL
jgi:hypothetical protein